MSALARGKGYPMSLRHLQYFAENNFGTLCSGCLIGES